MFSIKESFRWGWTKTKSNLWKMAGLVAITAIPSFITAFLNSLKDRSDSAAVVVLLVLITVIFNIVSIIIGIGLTKILLRMHDGENPPTREIFSAHGVFWKYLGGSVLYGLIVLGGIILLVVPGIVWAIKYSLTPLIIVDKKLGPIAAIKESGRVTAGSRWKLLGFIVLSTLVVMLGYIAFFVGALVTIPIAMLAWIYVYRTLSAKRAELSEIPSPQAAL